MNVVSTKNKYKNIKGSKKIKLLTAGKVYRVREIRDCLDEDYYLILDDTNRTIFYNKKHFHSILKSRDKILTDLGI